MKLSMNNDNNTFNITRYFAIKKFVCSLYASMNLLFGVLSEIEPVLVLFCYWCIIRAWCIKDLDLFAMITTGRIKCVIKALVLLFGLLLVM